MVSEEGSRFRFVGGQGCLDFLNTLLPKRGGHVETFVGFRDLVAWLAEAGMIEAAEAGSALDEWDGTREGEWVLGRAKVFREILRDVAGRLAGGQAIEQTSVDEINALLGSRSGHNRVVRTEGGFEVRFSAEVREPVHLLAPVAGAAGELLCRGEGVRVKTCEKPGCTFYFYDTTKNRARRWCSMATCGNRMKAAAHYRRRRARED